MGDEREEVDRIKGALKTMGVLQAVRDGYVDDEDLRLLLSLADRALAQEGSK